MAKHISAEGKSSVRETDEAAPDDTEALASSVAKVTTGLLISDVLMRSGGRVLRMAVDKGMLQSGFDPKLAKTIVKNRTLGQSLVTLGISKVMTRSLPGAVLVGGGLVAKTLFDRSQSRRASRRAEQKALKQRAKQNDRE